MTKNAKQQKWQDLLRETYSKNNLNLKNNNKFTNIAIRAESGSKLFWDSSIQGTYRKTKPKLNEPL